MKVLCIDCYSQPEGHHYFNALIIKAFDNAPNVSWVGYCAETSQSMGVVKLLNGKLKKSLIVFNPDTFTVHWSRFKLGLLFIKRYKYVTKLIKEKKPDIIFFLTVDYTIWPLYAILFFLFSGKSYSRKLFVVVHDLYPITINKFKHHIWKKMFSYISVKPILLATTVGEKFRVLFPQKVPFIWPHPHYEEFYGRKAKYESFLSSNKEINPVRILLAGRQAGRSLLSGFIDFLSAECEKISSASGTRLQIILVTPIPSPIILRENVTFINSRVTHEEYMQLLSAIEYVLFPLESLEEYMYRASSLLADAITFSTPIIAPNSGVFKEMFEKYASKAGWLYSNLEELRSILQSVATASSSEYRQIQDCFSTVRKELSANKTSTILWEIVGLEPLL